MEKLTKDTFEKIVELLKQLIDTHVQSYAWHKSDYNDEVIGYRLRIENTEWGRISVLLAGYLFHPIKGYIRRDVRKEFAELGLSYPLPAGYPQTHGEESDEYTFFSDGVIRHTHQDLEMHTDEKGNNPSYVTNLGDLNEKEGQELVVHLKNILDEEKQRNLLKEDKVLN